MFTVTLYSSLFLWGFSKQNDSWKHFTQSPNFRKFYYYRQTDSSYYLFALGPDEAVFTEDDVYPPIVKKPNLKLGIVLDRQP